MFLAHVEGVLGLYIMLGMIFGDRHWTKAEEGKGKDECATLDASILMDFGN